MIRNLFISGLVFGSLLFLGLPIESALFLATIPLIFGLIGIFQTGVSVLAGIIFVLACTSFVFPNWMSNSIDVLYGIVNTKVPTAKTQAESTK
jgi:hypothetical protein